MKEETGGAIKNLKVDGGATKNKLLMQFQSDIIETPIKLPACLETTALGAAYLAGLYTGFYKSTNDIKTIHIIDKKFTPSMARKEVKDRYKKWKLAVKATRVFE